VKPCIVCLRSNDEVFKCQPRRMIEDIPPTRSRKPVGRDMTQVPVYSIGHRIKG